MKPFRARISAAQSLGFRLLAAAAATVVVVSVGVAVLPASSAEADTVPSSTGVPGILNLTVAQKTIRAGEKLTPLRIVPQTDGTAMITLASDGSCLVTSGAARYQSGRTAYFSTCRDNEASKYTFVPADPTPSAVAGFARERQYFYIVSTYTGKCITGADLPGLNRVDGGPYQQNPTLEPCAAGSDAQKWRLPDDRPNPDGVNTQWRYILGLAVGQASRSCTDDLTSCSVSVSSAPNSWYRANDNALASKGTISTQNFGCGTPTTIDGKSISPRYTNTTQDNQAVQIGGQLSVTNTISSSQTFGTTTTVEANFGQQGIWGQKFTQTFTYQNQQVTGSTTAQSVTRTVSSTVRPGDSLMAVWAGRVYTISGNWRFGEKIATSSGSLRWTIPVSSSYPVSVAGEPLATITSITSRQPKSCDAVQGSSITAEQTPVITASGTPCSPSADTPFDAEPGTQLTACPGDWIVPAGKGSSTPDFRYQWYVFASDGDPGRNIPGATSANFTVQRSTYSAAAPFLGVRVWDAGNADRLESRPPVNAEIAVELLQPAAAAAAAVRTDAAVSAAAPVAATTLVATNFVGTLDDATTGVPYSAPLVTDPGSGMSLSATGLPDGMTVSPDGVLAGAATTPGHFDIQIVDTPTDGRAEQSQTIPLDVYDPSAEFETDRVVEATADTTLTEQLVPSVPAGMGLEVTDGVLPPGVSLDSASGVLSGTPTEPGSYSFALDDPQSPDTEGQFTVDVASQQPQFSGDLPAARVGAAYSASLAAASGTSSFFTLTADSPDLPEGLLLDSNTGVIAGTPSTAGSTVVQVIDVSNREASRTATIVVAPDGSTVAESGGRASLAATGASAPTGLLLLAVGLLLSAAVLGMLRRRSSHPRHNERESR